MEFEGEEFTAPACYDELLRRTYGDYMQLPPKEQQVTHHDFDITWRAREAERGRPVSRKKEFKQWLSF